MKIICTSINDERVSLVVSDTPIYNPPTRQPRQVKEIEVPTEQSPRRYQAWRCPPESPKIRNLTSTPCSECTPYTSAGWKNNRHGHRPKFTRGLKRPWKFTGPIILPFCYKVNRLDILEVKSCKKPENKGYYRIYDLPQEENYYKYENRRICLKYVSYSAILVREKSKKKF